MFLLVSELIIFSQCCCNPQWLPLEGSEGVNLCLSRAIFYTYSSLTFYSNIYVNAFPLIPFQVMDTVAYSSSGLSSDYFGSQQATVLY